jgi:predicted lipase
MIGFKNQVRDLMNSCAFSHLAYFNTTSIHRKIKKIQHVRLIKSYEPKCKDLQAAMFRMDSKLIIAFRGTTTKSDFIDALDIRHSFFEEVGTLLHNGFHNRFKTIEPILSNDIFKFILSCSAELPITHVYFTGHSMGGALATIATCYYGKHLQKKNVKVICHTFGSPHFADEELGKALKKVSFEHIAVHANDDVVPWLPIHHQFKHLPYVLELGEDGVSSCLIQDSIQYTDLIQKLIDIKDISALFKQHSCTYYYDKLNMLHQSIKSS